MENTVQGWAKELKQALGINLVSVILYGSAVRGEYVRARSDLNLMLVFKKLDLEHITKVGKLMRRKVRKTLPQLVFWTEKELANAWDVFPLEFEDIMTNHRCLVGKDPFTKRKVNKKHMRYQLEFELRSKLLNVRDSWLSLRRDKYALTMFLIKAGSPVTSPEDAQYFIDWIDAVTAMIEQGTFHSEGEKQEVLEVWRQARVVYVSLR